VSRVAYHNFFDSRVKIKKKLFQKLGFFEYLGMGVGFFEYFGLGVGWIPKTHTHTQFTQNTQLI